MTKNDIKNSSMPLSRREFALGGGICTLAFLTGGGIINLTPAQARSHSIAFRALNNDQVALIELFGEAIIPGAKIAGLSHYIDHQLAGDPHDNMLILRYLRVEPPFDGFYSSGLKALETAVRQKYAKLPHELTEAEISAFITVMMQKNPQSWPAQAPPAPFFYFVLRHDAMDVTYGTTAGFDRLDIPYMAHIEPVYEWDETP